MGEAFSVEDSGEAIYAHTTPHTRNQTESMNLSLKELKERTEAERQKNVIAVRARHLLVEVSGGEEAFGRGEKRRID